MHNPEDRSFIGHPKGLGYIAFTEAWERFSYYGMQALLVLYMVNRLLLPGHIEHIAGFVPFRHALEFVYRQPLEGQPLSSAIFGLYTAFVYLTPIIGGLIADRWLGRTVAITIGALLMTIGQFLVGLDVTFLIALAGLLIGVGLLKGNLASQVGALYATGDNRRADAFQIYYIFINGGVIAAPLIVGTLGEKVGWAWGFDAAGVGMIIGLAIYLFGRKYLPTDAALAEKKDGATGTGKAKLSRRDWTAIIALLVLLPFLAMAIIPNNQIFNAYLVWADRNAALPNWYHGQRIPTTWLITLDAVVSVSFLFIAVMFWRWWSKRFREPSEILKIAIGSATAVTGMLSLTIGAAIAARTGKQVPMGWLIAFHVLNSAGFANTLPVSLALYARVAPPSLSGTVIGIYYIAFFVANLSVGWIGGFLEKMAATQFWLLHAGLAAIASLIFFLAGTFFGHLFAPSDEVKTAA